jgi:ribonuclease D
MNTSDSNEPTATDAGAAGDASSSSDAASAEVEAEARPLAPLLELREPLPDVVATDADLVGVAQRLAAGSGPIAVDAERASGYRYSSRAYLIQLRREGAGTSLVDPIEIRDLTPLAEVLDGPEWILHAASQDLPCLAELDLRPTLLFDTELAGRLLGYPRVGLATIVEEVLGRRLRKEHSAVDWSTRPLPRPWLEYAALDVEPLVELRDALHGELVAAGKWEWAQQEFAHLITVGPAAPKAEPWRRTSGLHRARGSRALAAVRALWHARDDIAADRDVTPGRIIPDSAIVEAAAASPRDRESLMGLRGFHGRGANRYARVWLQALRDARELPEKDLPATSARYDGPPPPRAWTEKNPAAAARLTQARAALADLSEQHSVPVENLLTPETVRRVLWQPPGLDRDAVIETLRGHGARPWQIELTADLLTEAISTHPDAG